MIPAVTAVTVVIPILLLRGRTQSKEHHGQQPCRNSPLRNRNSLLNSHRVCAVQARRWVDGLGLLQLLPRAGMMSTTE